MELNNAAATRAGEEERDTETERGRERQRERVFQPSFCFALANWPRLSHSLSLSL